MPKKADREHISRNEQIRRFIKKGLTVDGYAEDIDFIASIIRQEFTAVYHIGDIKAVVEQQTNRLAKMLMKSGKMDAAAFFLLIKVLMNVAHDGTQDEFDQMLNEAVTLGVDYMQRKDFQINGFLQDTDNLRSLADKLHEALMANDIEYSKFLMQIQKMVRESLSADTFADTGTWGGYDSGVRCTVFPLEQIHGGIISACPAQYHGGKPGENQQYA